MWHVTTSFEQHQIFQKIADKNVLHCVEIRLSAQILAITHDWSVLQIACDNADEIIEILQISWRVTRKSGKPFWYNRGNEFLD